MNNFILSMVYGRFLEWVFRPMFNYFWAQAAKFAPSVLSLVGAGMQGKSASQAAKQQAAQSIYGSDLQRQSQIEDLEFRRQVANRGLGAGRSGQQRSSARFDQSMSDFGRDTTGTPTEISRLQNLIRRQALPEQRRAMAQGRLALEQQGVRGPESALLQQMQSNQMQESLANRAQQVALQQALADRGTRAELAAQQSLKSLPGSMVGTVDSDIEEIQSQQIERPNAGGSGGSGGLLKYGIGRDLDLAKKHAGKVKSYVKNSSWQDKAKKSLFGGLL